MLWVALQKSVSSPYAFEALTCDLLGNVSSFPHGNLQPQLLAPRVSSRKTKGKSVNGPLLDSHRPVKTKSQQAATEK